MTGETFDLEDERLKEEIRKRGAKRVLIQLPEGLKREGPRLARMAEESGALPIISADPCYGACDLPFYEAEVLRADLIIHYGHTEIESSTPTGVPIVYMEARAKIDVERSVKNALEYLEPWSVVGLSTVVQHVHELDRVRALLNAAGKTVVVGDAGRLKYPGQVIGCDYSNAEAISSDVEAFLFLGGGRFHALGLALATAKPVVVADPYEGRAYPIRKEDAQRVVRQRWVTISQAKEAENFAVIIGLKSGQMALDPALKIKRYLEEAGKNAVLLAMREITPEALQEFPSIEAFVNTACPRVSFDEASIFRRPVLIVGEALVMLGRAKWEELLEGGWFKKFL
ncbi:MAG: diptheria toxin resistance protein required for diphthamide biosynthesis (Saccharomyces)-like 1 [Candidatus Bathyarchaeota archaeon B26-2]|nr:MAG: diptheria toxin resistance protein required for diphthamide biosynthesis (Saccharomyces)-like 1 [Candidatus Bathyarchaeota archaeon B26-2]